MLLVACILLALPRGASRTSFIRRLAPDTFSKRAEQMKDSIPAGQGHDVFCVVFDAGSTGAPRPAPAAPSPAPLPRLGARGPPPLCTREASGSSRGYQAAHRVVCHSGGGRSLPAQVRGPACSFGSCKPAVMSCGQAPRSPGCGARACHAVVARTRRRGRARAGSRVHVYKFTQAGAKLDLQGDTFEQLKPGLSSFADDPQAAADSLQPLLQTALATVPEDLQARGPCAHT